MSEVNNIKEITFPVPWGVIAARTWGDPCLKPVIVVHGIQDNAGSFDRLIPHLPRLFYYVCLDLPGHGLSSRFPKGIRLDFMLYISAIYRVVKQLKWDKFYFLGHSLGGQLGTFYAAMYPEQVTKLITLDNVPPSKKESEEEFLAYYREMTDQVMKLENKMLDATPPSYTYESALDRLIKNRPTPITREAGEALLRRCLKQGKNGYYYTTDQRLKFYLITPMPQQTLIAILGQIQCPYLFIVTELLVHYAEQSSGQGRAATAKLSIDKLREMRNVTVVEVEGDHDVHNNEPFKVVPSITEFMLQEKSSL